MDIVRRFSSRPVSPDDERKSLERLRNPSIPNAWLEQKLEEHRQARDQLPGQVPGDPQFDLRIGWIRWHESRIRSMDQVLDERAVAQRKSPDRQEPHATKTLIVLRPVQQTTRAIYDVKERAGRTATYDAYRAECKAADVKIRRKEIGLAVKSKSKDPVTLVKKWLLCDPRYEPYLRSKRPACKIPQHQRGLDRAPDAEWLGIREGRRSSSFHSRISG
jgi:hypothetical protein